MRAIYHHMRAELNRHPHLLVSHREDFELLDHTELTFWGAPGTSYLWIVRPNGSDITLLDVHPSLGERGLAILNISGDLQNVKTFLASEKGTSEISHERAAQLLRGTCRYEIDGARILLNGRTLARSRSIVNRGYARQPTAEVQYLSERPLNTFEVVALRQLASVLVRKEHYDMPIDSIKIDNVDIAEERCNALRRDGLIRLC